MVKNFIVNTILTFILLFIPNYSHSWTSTTHWTPATMGSWYTWESAGIAQTNITLSPAQPDGDTTTLRITTPAGMTSASGQQIAGASLPFASENEMWSQYYVYYPSTYTFHPVAEKISSFQWPSNSTNNALLVWAGGSYLLYSPQIGWMGYIDFSPNTGYSPSPTKNHWYKFTEHVKMNTPGKLDGVYQLWVDDQMVMDYSNVPFRNTGDTSGFNKFIQLLVWGGQGGGITLGSDMYQYRGTSTVSSESIMPSIIGPLPIGYKPMSPSKITIK